MATQRFFKPRVATAEKLRTNRTVEPFIFFNRITMAKNPSNQEGIVEAQAHPPQSEDAKALVTVSVDQKKIEIHRGSWLVSQLKIEAKVPSNYDLDQILPGEPPIPLKDDERITIKGGEVFASHVR